MENKIKDLLDSIKFAKESLENRKDNSDLVESINYIKNAEDIAIYLNESRYDIQKTLADEKIKSCVSRHWNGGNVGSIFLTDMGIRLFNDSILYSLASEFETGTMGVCVDVVVKKHNTCEKMKEYFKSLTSDFRRPLRGEFSGMAEKIVGDCSGDKDATHILDVIVSTFIQINGENVKHTCTVPCYVKENNHLLFDN